MQLIRHRNHHEKTIEGDLFRALVAAGAISKANADDPKKSSLNRCARTDKGVHAAGNLISLKLIMEDQDIVNHINQHLSPQIRVFGIERTNNSFSAYQLCDSRIYEYLIPTHVFVPPHPKSFLGKKLAELAEEAQDTNESLTRQKEVSCFWGGVEDQNMKPILEKLDSSTRSLVLQAFYELDPEDTSRDTAEAVPSYLVEGEDLVPTTMSANDLDEIMALKAGASNAKECFQSYVLPSKTQHNTTIDQMPEEENRNLFRDPRHDGTLVTSELMQNETHAIDEDPKPEIPIQNSIIEPIVRQLKGASLAAKNAYRIDPARLARVRSVLSQFVGPHNFHNYTVSKSFADASAKRVIKTFVLLKNPIIIKDTEWLSLKVHGQSFMMHQIRKMISMTALVVRCGCHEERIRDSYMQDKICIPKAPGLGLLLERPVFDTYNDRFAGQRERLDFGKYETEMEEFKQREIYERIFREEERDNQ